MCHYIVTESLNTDMVKAENPEIVVATELQGKKKNLYFSIQNSLFTKVSQLANVDMQKFWADKNDRICFASAAEAAHLQPPTSEPSPEENLV